MRENFKYLKEAKVKLPAGFYILGANFSLRNDDIVWNWTSHEFLRADSPEWLFSPLEFNEDVICAARQVARSEFADQVQTKRVFTLKR